MCFLNNDCEKWEEILSLKEFDRAKIWEKIM